MTKTTVKEFVLEASELITKDEIVTDIAIWDGPCTASCEKPESPTTKRADSSADLFPDASKATIDVCNALLRGEMTATETYAQAAAKFADFRDDDSLGCIRDEHQQSVTALRDLIRESGGAPAATSGVWGGFAHALEGAAKLFGETPALLILEQGELKGISDYEAALTDSNLSSQAIQLINQDLLPPLYDHLVELKGRRENVAEASRD